MGDRIPEGWRECKLGEVITLQRGYDLPKENMINGNIPVAGSKGIIGYHNQSTTKSPGVTIGRSGNLGNASFYNTDFWAHNTTLYVRDFKGNDEKFVFYFLSNLDFNQFNAGSAVPTLNRNHVHSLYIKIPPLPEQRAIASVLGSLDDKIDLLNRENKTLEQMAETLFRQWFIEEADEGWEEVPLDQIATFLNGLACQKYPPKNEVDKLPVLKIKELRNGFTDNFDWATTDIPGEYIVQNGDVIFSWSGSLLVKIWEGTKCVLNQHLFKVTSEHYLKWFYYLWTKHHMDRFISIAEGKATTMGHIKRGDLSNSLVLIPETNELNEMDKIISPLIDKIIGASGFRVGHDNPSGSRDSFPQ
ncbi:MAG: EcoKI restriction-modification system protein HsdS [Spirochaetes bacterium ADurb.Bin110]|nr:MAG: EcoKI restriction-modification system protein HsdS [Spirochaetes bacterium ADurb.Bin110]